MVTVLIAGGGTGGHVFPMLAIGDAAKAMQSDVRVVYVGTPRGLEKHVLKDRGYELYLLNVAPLRGGGLSGFFRGIAQAAIAVPRACALVKRLSPAVVLSVGGYAGGPVSLAARLLNVPVTLLEPNSVLGLSNYLLGPFVERAYVAFPEPEKYFRHEVVRRYGVPLRSSFLPSPYVTKVEPISLLVLGGSQGAKALNEVLPQAIASGVALGLDLRVTHQTGRDGEAAVCERYDEPASPNGCAWSHSSTTWRPHWRRPTLSSDALGLPSCPSCAPWGAPRC